MPCPRWSPPPAPRSCSTSSTAGTASRETGGGAVTDTGRSTEERLARHLRTMSAELRAARTRAEELEAQRREPVAVVGIGCRYPGGVDSAGGLWRVVSEGRDAIRGLPTDRGWDLADLYGADPDAPGSAYSTAGGFLDDVAGFDAEFFGISPREATTMDPQQRLLLETAWEAVENAGIDPHTLRDSRTGVFAGSNIQDYSHVLAAAPRAAEGYVVTGTTSAMVSGRISYTFGLAGPSATIDTACSSSLVALHLAVRALRAGECVAALAGGATVLATTRAFTEFSRQRALAPDGRCKAFGAGADGFGLGEGAGMLFLERLSDALRHGHPVLAVIRGSAVNSDGASNGITAPSGHAQERVLAEALAASGVAAHEVDLVEAHGTGTRLGDPIEARALMAVYGTGRATPLWVGSVKSNLGHTQAAAGVAGVIKTVLALRHRTLPPTLHADVPTPEVDWSAGGVLPLSHTRPWPDGGRPRRAGVSAFGISGTNAHLIVEEYPPGTTGAGGAGGGAGAGTAAAARASAGGGRATAAGGTAATGGGAGAAGKAGPPLLPWLVSAHSEAALAAQAGKLLGWCGERPDARDAMGTATGTGGAATGTASSVTGTDSSVAAREGAGVATGHGAGAGTCPEKDSAARSAAGGNGPGQGSTDGTDRAGDGPRAHSGIDGQGSDDPRAVDPGTVDPGAVARALARTRSRFAHRAVLLAEDTDGFRAALAALAAGASCPDVVRGRAAAPGRQAFLFSGQGGQRPGMGRELYAAFPAYAAAFDAVCAQLDPHLRRPLREVVFAEPGTEGAALLDTTEFAQPALFALETALFALYSAWGLRPDRLLGHSVGEVVAAHVAGVLSLADACTLVAARGRLMQELPPGGSMAAVEASEAEVTPLLRGREDRAGVAAVNGPRSVTVAGDRDVVAEVAAHWRERGRRVRPLNVSHAFHSPRMDGMLDAFLDIASSLRYGEPTLPLVSSVTGQQATGKKLADPRYWVEHVRRTVRFHDGLCALRSDGITAFLELGPDGSLTGTAAEGAGPDELCVTALRRGQGEVRAALMALARLHCHGVEVDWTALLPGRGPHLDLPTYAFQRERYWQEAEPRPGQPGDRRFWSLVADGDTRALAAELGVEPDAGLSRVVPALHTWRARTARSTDAPAPRYGITWRPVPPGAGRRLSGTWLLVGDDCGLGARLGALGAEVHHLPVPGPADREGLAPLLLAAAPRPEGVVSTLALRPPGEATGTDTDTGTGTHADGDGAGDGHTGTGPDSEAGSGSHTDTGSDTGAGSGDCGPSAATLALVQALGDAGVSAPLWCLTRGAVGVSGEPPDPDAAAVWGLGRVAALELPERWGGLIDLPPARNSDTPDGDTPGAGDTPGGSTPSAGDTPDAANTPDGTPGRLDLLLAAALTGGGEDQLAMRGGTLLARRVVPLPAPAARMPKLSGTALVTGGTGGLGARVAVSLAARGAEHLLLLSRRGPDAPGAGRLRARLAKAGAEVTIRSCDVSDRAALARVLAEDVPGDRPLRAVVHAAGVLDDGILDAQTPERLEAVLAAKGRAARHLHELTRRQRLDAFVLFSSLAGVVGNAGQGNYAAANAQLDALAEQRHAEGLPATSVAWGPWAEDGMARALESGQLRGSGLRPLEPDRAVDALWSAVAEGTPTLLVADVDWDGYAARAAAFRPSPQLAELTAAAAGPAASARLGTEELAGLTAEQRRARLLEVVREQIAVTLGHGARWRLDGDRPFHELGFDSLTAVELRNRLDAVTGLRLPSTLVFDHPTADALVTFLLAELCDETAGGPEPPLAALDRLEAVLAATPLDGAGRDAVAGRLRELLRTCSAGPSGEDAVASVGESAGEVVDFITGQLGITLAPPGQDQDPRRT
ncbi:type I polyketide synthase [Streptomyces albus]|uniref:type I polyketide synthase n=1 Tax=Streptomyces albus TaxID=1888 RepID=UPI00099E900B